MLKTAQSKLIIFIIIFLDHLYLTSELLLQASCCGDLPPGLGAQTRPFNLCAKKPWWGTFACSLIERYLCSIPVCYLLRMQQYPVNTTYNTKMIKNCVIMGDFNLDAGVAGLFLIIY